MPKLEVSDPQGQTIQQALRRLGFDGVVSARVGKRIELVVDAEEDSDAEAQVISACEKFLANKVIEEYSLEVSAFEGAG